MKGNDPIGDTPLFHFHDYGRKGRFASPRPRLAMAAERGRLGWSHGYSRKAAKRSRWKNLQWQIKVYSIGIPYLKCTVILVVTVTGCGGRSKIWYILFTLSFKTSQTCTLWHDGSFDKWIFGDFSVAHHRHIQGGLPKNHSPGITVRISLQKVRPRSCMWTRCAWNWFSITKRSHLFLDKKDQTEL